MALCTVRPDTFTRETRSCSYYNSLNNLLTPLNNLLTRPCSYYNSLRNHFQPLVEGAILADFPNLPLASPKPQPPELDFAVQVREENDRLNGR